MKIKLVLLPEEQVVVRDWMKRARLYALAGAVHASVVTNNRTTRFDIEPASAEAVAKLLRAALDSGRLVPASHLHRALGYINGMLRHELAKKGVMIA